jgi:hypothetical protein
VGSLASDLLRRTDEDSGCGEEFLEFHDSTRERLMGLTVVLQDAHGNPDGGAVEDTENLIAHLLPAQEDGAYHYLPYIDRYGDTIFNRSQMEPFLREWRLMTSRVRSIPERRVLQAVESLALKCADDPHLYIRFLGD